MSGGIDRGEAEDLVGGKNVMSREFRCSAIVGIDTSIRGYDDIIAKERMLGNTFKVIGEYLAVHENGGGVESSHVRCAAKEGITDEYEQVVETSPILRQRRWHM